MVTSLDALERILSTEQTDLLVLCHSLSMEECGRSIALTLPWPRIRSLILTVGPESGHALFPGTILDAMDGPAKLVSIVGKLVQSESKVNAQIY